MKKHYSNQRGFSLIEILIVIGLIAILASVVIVAINPARQFKLARDSQRTSNVAAILSAFGQNIAEHKGVFTCEGGAVDLPTSKTKISDDGFDAAPCLVSDYISALPYDPSAEGAHFESNTDYDTGYSIVEDEDTGRITVSAPETELAEEEISVTR